MAQLPEGVSICEFDPKTAERPEWSRVHAFRRLRHAETQPEDPLSPDDVVEMEMKLDSLHTNRTLLAERGGCIIGRAILGWQNPEAPAYESNKQFGYYNIHVLKPERRHGLGSALLRQALVLFEAAERTVLTTHVEEEDGHAFVRWLGAESKLVGAENRLDLRAVDWDMVHRWIEEGRVRSPDTELQFFENRIPDDFMPVYCPALSAMLNTMPFDDMEHGEIAITPESMRLHHYAWLDEVDGAHHTFVTREPDGSVSGITDVGYAPHEPDRIEQYFTGVRTDCRGRGLGKLLKATMLEYLRATYPDARWVITGNANSNDPMLHINRRLGFRTHRTGATYQIGRDALAARLATA